MKENKISNYIYHTGRILFGLVFIFSGFVKAVDPLGLTYKLQDYFTSFGGLFLQLSNSALVLAILLSTIETVIGLNLVFGIKVRFTAIIALLFMLVMTPLTLYIAIYNPVSDCGCFGDAIKITNWQTFIKNIILLPVIITVLITYGKKRSHFVAPLEITAILLFSAFGTGISVYAYRHLPQIDFLPYKTGTNIAEAMFIPENANMDEYMTTFIYEKEGVQKEFTLDNYPKDDSTWVFVDQKTTLIKEGYQPPIHNFNIYNKLDEDIVPDIIDYTGYTYILVMYDLNKASVEGAQLAQKIYNRYKHSSTRFYAVTASGEADIAAFSKKTGTNLPYYKADPITLKTIIRANPGLVLIKNGTITGKWNWRDFE